MVMILWAIAAVVLVIWLLGLIFRFAGNAIHLLLIIALAVAGFFVLRYLQTTS